MAAGVLRHVRCHGDSAHFGDKALGVLVLAGPKVFLVGTSKLSHHRLGCIPFTGARALRDLALSSGQIDRRPLIAQERSVGIWLLG